MFSNKDDPPRIRRWSAAAYGVGLVVAIAIAWLIGRRGRTGPLAIPDDGHRPVTSRPEPDAAPIDPDAVLGTSGLHPLDSLPDDLAIPPAAECRSIISRRVLGDEQIKAEYVVEGDLAAVAESMAERVAALGWQPAGAAAGASEDKVLLLFGKSGDTLSLHLNRDGICVKIVAVIHRVGLSDLVNR